MDGTVVVKVIMPASSIQIKHTIVVNLGLKVPAFSPV